MQQSVVDAYRPLRKHAELFDDSEGWRAEWFDMDFLHALSTNVDSDWAKVITTYVPGHVFSCKMFAKEFCELLVDEVDNFMASGLPARRPNTMNNYGLILNDIGFRPMIDLLQTTVLAKVAVRHWPQIKPFDRHHTFIVRYKVGEDLGLDMHTDASDVTFNVCLGKEFTGAGLSFCGVRGRPEHRKHIFTYQHELGRACWHLGRQRHGADDISSGERLNLIIWNTSSRYQQSEDSRHGYENEAGPPDAICLSYTHDRDYGVFKEYTEKNRDHAGRGWCPPDQAAYSGFVPEDVGCCAPARGGLLSAGCAAM
mmetsp:Transcript_14672/g.40399  ORF Transcript_14672/g.40399 Transcript_14672/m.40399 type:complete len:311 (+) Transcript_14672:105-1037(+)